MTDTPSQSNFDRRAFLRSINFWRPADLSIHVGSVGDDYRGNLATSETVIYGLLLCHSVSPGFDTNTNTWTKGEGKCVSGERDPVTHQPILRHVAYNSRQPVVATLWDRGGGIVPWITDGRQRGRSSEGMSLRESVGEMGAVEAINHRLKMIVDLAYEIDPPDASPHLNANELSIKVRNEAKMRCQKFNAGDVAFKDWHWAKNGEIALYLGGRLGDEKSNQQQHGLINWRSMSDGGPLAVEFVCWTVFEPDDRDPASVETLIGSVVLKQAHVADPPSVECRRTAAIINAPDDPVFPGEGVPVSTLARLFGVSRVTIQKRAQIMMLIPEVRDELDAYARGEDGLSMVQVHDGGFFHAGSGSDDVRIPKTRDEQLALIAKLKGTRGIGALREADPGRLGATGAAGSGEGSGKERNYSESSPRELGSGDSGLARHAADEPRAPVGPDSPTAAGIAPKAAALTPDLARAIADSIDGKIEEMTPNHEGKLADGTEASADDQQVRRQLLAVYQFLRLMAGDVTALTGDDEMPAAVNKFRLTCRDAVEEVLQAHGMAIKPVGMVSTGAPVLAAGARQPAELIVTPRAGGEAAVVDGLAGAASGGATGGAVGAVVRKSKHGAAVKKKGLDKKARAAVTAGVEVVKPVAVAKVAKVKAVKEPKVPKMPKPAKPVKEKVVKPAKEVKVKTEKPVKVAKEPKAAKPSNAAKASTTSAEPAAS